WKKIPGAPKLESIEKCADLLIFMHHLNKERAKKTTKAGAVKLGMNPKLLNALALDLLCASCIKDYKGPGSVPNFPGPLLHLLTLALGLEALTKPDAPNEDLDPVLATGEYVIVLPNDQFTLVEPTEEPPKDELKTYVGYAPGEWDYHKLLP